MINYILKLKELLKRKHVTFTNKSKIIVLHTRDKNLSMYNKQTREISSISNLSKKEKEYVELFKQAFQESGDSDEL